jgi:tryptophan synthase alpha chain
MSRIREKFRELKDSGRGGFIPFITIGDPDLATTERLLIELANSGADIIELGMPFSDPVADGEVIQRASERALRNGVTLQDALTCASNVRKRIDVPFVLFSYFNPLLQFGQERLAVAASQAGIDAVLVTDLIPEEAESWTQNLAEHRLAPKSSCSVFGPLAIYLSQLALESQPQSRWQLSGVLQTPQLLAVRL